MVSVQVSEGEEAIKAIADEWDALVPESFAAVFSRPAWCLAWLDTFKPKRVVLITARAGNRLVGVLPLVRIRTDARGLFFTQVAPAAPGITDYQPPIVYPELESVALPAMLDAALGCFGRQGVYWWPNIPANAPSLSLLRAYLTAHAMPFVEELETAPRLRLVGSTYSEVELSWSSSHRVDVRRQRKRLAEQGALSLWQPATLAEAEVALAAYFQVHDEKWLAQGLPGRFQKASERSHFESVLRRLWGRGLHFSTLRSGSTNVSYLFGFFSGGWLQSYRPTYRSEFARFSPTKVHTALLVEEGCRLRWQGLDFLLGAEPYKLQWSNESIEVVSIHAGFHPWAPSYFWSARGKPFARKHLQRAYFRALAWAQRHRRRS